MDQRDSRHQRQLREAAGMLAVGLADELARPLCHLRDVLASAVATLDEHVAHAKGPDPLSYEQSKTIRETIADAYLKSADAARTAGDLAAALAGPGSVENGDLNKLLDDAVGLVRHRFSASTELFVDLGTLPAVSLSASDFVLAIARVLLHCADSTSVTGEAAVSIRSRLIGDPSRGDAQITIAENGRGADDTEIATVTGLARSLAERLGGSFAVAAEPNAGATFELRLPIGHR